MTEYVLEAGGAIVKIERCESCRVGRCSLCRTLDARESTIMCTDRCHDIEITACPLPCPRCGAATERRRVTTPDLPVLLGSMLEVEECAGCGWHCQTIGPLA